MDEPLFILLKIFFWVMAAAGLHLGIKKNRLREVAVLTAFPGPLACIISACEKPLKKEEA